MRICLKSFAILSVILLVCVGIAQATTTTIDLDKGSNCTGLNCQFEDVGTIFKPQYPSYYQYGLSGVSGGMSTPATLTFTYNSEFDLINGSTISFYTIPDSPLPAGDIGTWSNTSFSTSSPTDFLGTIEWTCGDPNKCYDGSPVLESGGTGTVIGSSPLEVQFNLASFLSGIGSNEFSVGVKTDCNWDGSLVLSYNSEQGAPPKTPEPPSLLLLGTGLGAIGLAAWRRRK